MREERTKKQNKKTQRENGRNPPTLKHNQKGLKIDKNLLMNAPLQPNHAPLQVNLALAH